MLDPPQKKKKKKRDIFKEVVVPYRVQPLIFCLAHESCCHCSPSMKMGENKAFFPPLSAPSIFARGFFAVISLFPKPWESSAASCAPDTGEASQQRGEGEHTHTHTEKKGNPEVFPD